MIFTSTFRINEKKISKKGSIYARSYFLMDFQPEKIFFNLFANNNFFNSIFHLHESKLVFYIKNLWCENRVAGMIFGVFRLVFDWWMFEGLACKFAEIKFFWDIKKYQKVFRLHNNWKHGCILYFHNHRHEKVCRRSTKTQNKGHPYNT